MEFHKCTQQVIYLAKQEVVRMNDTMLRDGHMVIAMIRQGTSVVSKKFCEAGMNLDEARFVYKRCRMACVGLALGSLAPSAALLRGIERAAEIATEMGDAEICPIHLFLAFRQDQYSNTAAILKAFGFGDEFVSEIVAAYEEKKKDKEARKLMVALAKRAPIQCGFSPGARHVDIGAADPLVIKALERWLGIPKDKALGGLAYQVTD